MNRLEEVLKTPFQRTLLYSDDPPTGLYYYAHTTWTPGRGWIVLNAKDSDSKMTAVRWYIYNHPGQTIVLEMSQATPPQQNALLKVLEDDTNNFIILHSSKPLLTTIESRMQVIAHPDDKFAPVVAGKPQEPQEEERLHYRDKLPADERNLVIRALKALHDHDGAALNALAVKWTDTTTEALRQWCSEAISQQWKQFDEEDSLFSGVQIPLAILLAISKNVRPKLVVRAGLAALI